jgi:sugar lactone lactonase YvrE
MVSRRYVEIINLLIALALTGCSALALPQPTATPSPVQPSTATRTATTTELPSETPGDPTATYTQTVLPGTPPTVADPLWAVDEPDGNLLVIDPADNSVAVIIPTGIHPRWLAISDDFVWALDPGVNMLLQIDRRSYAILRSIPFPDQQVDALAAGADGVWVGVTEHNGPVVLLPQEEDTPQGGILRLDPNSGQTTGYAKTGPVIAIIDSPDSHGIVWALARGQVDTPLLRVDPQTLAFQSLSIDGTPDWLLEDTFAISTDSLWLFSSAFGRLYRAAPDGHLYATIPFPQRKPISNAAILVSQDGSLWLATPWGSLVHYDSRQELVAAEIGLPFPANSLAEAGGGIWAVSPLGGTAYRIDPSKNAIVAEVSLGAKALPTPRVTPTAIHRASRPCPDAPYSRLAIGAEAVTPGEPALPNRLHKEPGKDADLSGYIQPGQRVKIIDGPQCADGWVWWKVHNEINQDEGWAAEGDSLEYWLIPLY